MSELKPYYQDDAVTIYHGDCRDILPHLPKVDLVLTDPPYDAKTHDGAIVDGGIDFSPLGSASAIARLLLEATLSWAIAFCSLEMIGQYAEASAGGWIRAGVWDRVVNMPQISGDRPAQAAEGIAFMHRGGRKVWNGGGRAAIFRHQVERGNKSHPTQKPLLLFTELLSLFPGDLVLDPFMGSGTTLRAAKDLGRKAVGIEIEEKYCEISAKRMAQEVMF